MSASSPQDPIADLAADDSCPCCKAYGDLPHRDWCVFQPKKNTLVNWQQCHAAVLLELARAEDKRDLLYRTATEARAENAALKAKLAEREKTIDVLVVCADHLSRCDWPCAQCDALDAAVAAAKGTK